MDFELLLPIWVVVCPLVFVAGLVDAVAGGGGLISLPAYLLAGLPPHTAMGTNKCGNLFGTLLATIRFVRQGHYHLTSALVAAVAALIGAYGGSRLNLILPEQILFYLMLVVVPILAVLVLRQKELGLESKIDRFSPRTLLVLCGAVGLVLGGYDGFFGPGAGTLITLALTGICGFDLLTACGNTKIINTASNVASLVAFTMAGQVWWQVGIPAALCNIAGSYVGSSMALKKGAKIIRPMFLVVLSLLLLRLVWELLAG